jgi:putative transposase
MIAFVDDRREAYGAEPICRALPIAPSTCHAHVARRADPAKASPRARRDLALMERIRRVHAANFEVYGARKVRRQLGREGIAVARCTVERLVRRMGLQGAVRGKQTGTTIADEASPRPADKVNRRFRAPQPNVLWVSDFTQILSANQAALARAAKRVTRVLARGSPSNQCTTLRTFIPTAMQTCWSPVFASPM